jgi:hypothetical protein
VFLPPDQVIDLDCLEKREMPRPYTGVFFYISLMKTIFSLVFLFIILAITNLSAQGPSWVWAASTGGPGNEVSLSITSDLSGNIYSTGYFSDSVDFDPGNGVTKLYSNGLQDAYITKMDPNGNLLWAKSLGGIRNDEAFSLAVDNSGNTYITGTFGDTVDFDPGADTTLIVSSDYYDGYIMKLDPAGNLVWANSFGGDNHTHARYVTLDAGANILISGHFAGQTDFNPGAGAYNVYATGAENVYILKLNNAGAFMWVKTFEGIFSIPTALKVDVSGNIYTTGYFDGTADFNPGAATYNLTSVGNNEIFVAKLNSSGNFVWAKKVGGSWNDDPHSMTVDLSGNVYIAGSFSDTVDFDPGPGTFNLISNNYDDGFILKLSSTGNFVWASSISGGNYDKCTGVITDSSGFVYLTGVYYGIIDIDPGLGIFMAGSSGTGAAYITKLDATGNLLWMLNHGGDFFPGGRQLCLNPSGNIYLHAFYNTASANNGPFVMNNYDSSGSTTDILTAKLDIGTGIEQGSEVDQKLLMFPNPANNLVTIQWNYNCKNVKVTLLDMCGRIIKTTLVSGQKVDWNIKDLSNGSYIIKTESEKFTDCKQIMVLK